MTTDTTAKPSGAKPPPDEAPHLLVVDDDRVIREKLARYLVNNGLRVTTAEHARAARRKLEALAFDLLILDVMMPGESGLDLARGIRKGETNQPSTVPIVMLTALAESSHRISGLETGADDYVSSPSSPVNWCCGLTRSCAGPPPPSPPSWRR